MASVLPVTAKLHEPEAPRPVEARLSADCWLGQRGSLLRGYLNSRWTFSRAEQPKGASSKSSLPNGANGSTTAGAASSISVRGGAGDWNPPLIARHQAIGSRLHLDFAAQPETLEAFFHPHAAMMDIDSPALALAL